MDQIFYEVVKLVGAVTAPVLAGLALALLVKYLKKAGIEVDLVKQAKFQQIAQDAILSVEEYAANAAKKRIKISSADKLKSAVAQVMGKVPGISDIEATHLIEAGLAKVGLGAIAALQAARNAAETPDGQ